MKQNSIVVTTKPTALRTICALGFLLGAGLFMFATWQASKSGTVVGTAELWSTHQNGVNDILEAYRQNSPLIGNALDTQWMQSKPLRLTPEMGIITLSVKETERGLVKRDTRDSRVEYIVLNTHDRHEILHQKTHWGGAKSSKNEYKLSPSIMQSVTIGTRTNHYSLGKITAPGTGDYVVLAGIDKWFLASSEQTLMLIAETGKTDPDPIQMALGVGIAFLSIAVLAMSRRKTETTDHWKIKQ